MDDHRLGEILREKLPRYSPPPDLEGKIRAQLSSARSEADKRERVVPFRSGSWIAIAAGIAVALGVGFNLGQRSEAERDFGLQLVSNQVRAQETDHLVDVVSTDRHTVKPWLASRLEFSPPVADLAADGYPLSGGRLDRVGGTTAAALVYRRNQHVITVYIWPAAGASLPPSGELLGYRVRSWRTGDLAFAAVSDVAPADLANFVARLKDSAP